jgi:2-polyprenyl-6-methoxyphenol hydroxylase-like FAD-dependent oxidoreductase
MLMAVANGDQLGHSGDGGTDSISCEVLVVGAGPVGLLTTLLLAQADVDVVLIESLPDVDNSPRAMAYGPAAVVELERAGIAKEAREVGMATEDFDHRLRWITIDNKLLAEFKPEDKLPGSFDAVICGQYQLAEIMKRHIGKFGNARVSGGK